MNDAKKKGKKKMNRSYLKTKEIFATRTSIILVIDSSQEKQIIL